MSTRLARLGTGTRLPLGVGLASALTLAVLGWFAPAIVLHGWLIGFASVGGIAFGSMACLAIHALTGGRWGEVARASFLLGAGAVPPLLLLGLPLILCAPLLYPWAADPNSAGPGVAAAYLHPGFLGLRSLVVIGGLSVFAVLARLGSLGTLTAGLCLLFYAAGMNLSSFDWILSLDTRFNSSAFGMQLIIQQIASALAFAILTTDAPEGDPAWGDLAALLFAAVLGESYLVLMTYIIEWYGDLPDQAAYYLRRSLHGWRWLELSGTLVGALLPMTGLLFARVRQSPPSLRIVAAAVLVGIWAEDAWLIAPEAGDLIGPGGLSALAGLLAVLAFGGLMLGFARRDIFALVPRRVPDAA